MASDRGPPLGEAALLVAVVFGLALAAGVIGGASARLSVVQLVAVGAPAVVYAMVHPAGPVALLGLSRPRSIALCGGAIAGLGVLAFNLAVLVPLSFEIFGRPTAAPPGPSGALAWQLVGVALIPAVCEELVFRGVLFRSLARRSIWMAVPMSAAAFALFHFSTLRLLPTFAVGVVCAVVVARSRSTFPAIICHLTNNATLIILVHVAADLDVLPRAGWAAIGIILIGFGSWLVRASDR